MRKNSIHKSAILVFARDLDLDLSQRGWSRHFRRLLQLPAFLTRQDADLHIFTTGSSSATCRSRFPSATVHQQFGSNFGESLEEAVETLSQLGYAKIVIVGRDCPELSSADLSTAFEELDRKQLVLGPDHRGGLYLIGLHAGGRNLIVGIEWQKNSDFREAASRVPPEDLFTLPVRQDLDSYEDLCRLARRSSRVARLVRRFLRAKQRTHFRLTSTPRLSHRPREIVGWQLPPPAFGFFKS